MAAKSSNFPVGHATMFAWYAWTVRKSEGNYQMTAPSPERKLGEGAGWKERTFVVLGASDWYEDRASSLPANFPDYLPVKARTSTGNAVSIAAAPL